MIKTLSLLSVFCMLLAVSAQSVWAEAKIKIAVLSALDSETGRRFYNDSDYNINKKILSKFQAKLGEGFEISFFNRVDLQTVWEVLHDSQYEGVYFIGHASSGSDTSSALSQVAMISDSSYNDLKYAFQKVHPQLRFLGIIGCNAKSIFENFISKGYYANAPQLKIKSFDTKVEIWKGIDETISDSLKTLKVVNVVVKKTSAASISSTNVSVLVKRIIPYGVPAEKVRPTLIMKDDQVIGFFPKESPGMEQAATITLSSQDLDRRFTISNNSGLNSSHKKTNIELGELSTESTSPNCELIPMTNSKNEIMGVGKHYYRMKCITQEDSLGMEF